MLERCSIHRISLIPGSILCSCQYPVVLYSSIMNNVSLLLLSSALAHYLLHAASQYSVPYTPLLDFIKDSSQKNLPSMSSTTTFSHRDQLVFSSWLCKRAQIVLLGVAIFTWNSEKTRTCCWQGPCLSVKDLGNALKYGQFIRIFLT